MAMIGGFDDPHQRTARLPKEVMLANSDSRTHSYVSLGFLREQAIKSGLEEALGECSSDGLFCRN